MDHGKLTDHAGKQIDFRNVILIMTTNAGAQDLAKEAFGFHKSKREGDDTEAINRLFSPEFRNRLDAIVPFARLPESVIAQVVDKFVMQLEAQLADRNVTIELTDEARAWLVKNGYDEAMGARPMARVIQSQIKTPLADEVLFGRLKNGGVVRVVVTAEDGGVKKLGFVYPEGPAQPRLERDLIVAGRKRAEGEPETRRGRTRKRADGAGVAGEDSEAPDEVSPSEPQAT
jgi:ATP-dependent Clp protease ATP-binding subunit ClpA